ncbi:MAG: NAD(P)-dependent oxidoreductase [Bacillati bacterium ANGP1]|uniref:NAD(P)-dependent oxidoreductase n=1 Tax=Candidatus Segetimicrobium genomatis TaxID=2569760 RepID=A0A537LL70_9BACT|nr:MAG: NAD(P)-dependent oxidoreductase [Terrabacteria group bacterium ANGP1]
MHVLVTGGAGYLGSVLCEHLLQAGYQVTIVDNLTHGQQSLFHLLAHTGVEFVFGDVRDDRLLRRLLKSVDVVIPLAAIVGARACDRDPWLARAINFEAVALLNQLRSPRQLVVFATTNSGYGTRTDESYCTEDTPLEPISLYGRTKVEAETVLLQTPDSISLRLATVFGLSPRMRIDLLVNYFVHAAVTDGYIVIFEKDFKRNYVHIRDVADCFVHCIEHAEHMVGRPYNVGLDSANLSKEELALRVKQYVPNFYIHFSDIGTDPDRRNYIVSNQRLREAGFEARRTLDEGIQELLKGYRMMIRTQFQNV